MKLVPWNGARNCAFITFLQCCHLLSWLAICKRGFKKPLKWMEYWETRILLHKTALHAWKSLQLFMYLKSMNYERVRIHKVFLAESINLTASWGASAGVNPSDKYFYLLSASGSKIKMLHLNKLFSLFCRAVSSRLFPNHDWVEFTKSEFWSNRVWFDYDSFFTG